MRRSVLRIDRSFPVAVLTVVAVLALGYLAFRLSSSVHPGPAPPGSARPQALERQALDRDQ